MELANLIDTQRVLLNVNADCPKAAFRCVSDILAPLSGIESREIADALLQRERMGSTAVGGGIAIPHARMDAVNEPQAFFVRLNRSIDMDAADDKPVDVLFILLVPSEADNDHLRVLSRIARILRAPENIEVIRSQNDPAAIASLFNDAA